jgi:hypothetical protein
MRRHDRRDAGSINVVLGVWLFASAFLWQHSLPTFINALVVGIVMVVSAIVAMRWPAARIVDTAAGVWLIASLFAWPSLAPATAWNNFFVGAAVALVSIIGPGDEDISAPTRLDTEDEVGSTA